MELSSGACGLFERTEIPTLRDAKGGALENSIAKIWVTRQPSVGEKGKVTMRDTMAVHGAQRHVHTGYPLETRR